MAVGTRCAGHVKPLYPQKLAIASPNSGRRSAGIVRLQTNTAEFFCFCSIYLPVQWLLHCVDIIRDIISRVIRRLHLNINPDFVKLIS